MITGSRLAHCGPPLRPGGGARSFWRYGRVPPIQFSGYVAKARPVSRSARDASWPAAVCVDSSRSKRRRRREALAANVRARRCSPPRSWLNLDPHRLWEYVRGPPPSSKQQGGQRARTGCPRSGRTGRAPCPAHRRREQGSILGKQGLRPRPRRPQASKRPAHFRSAWRAPSEQHGWPPRQRRRNKVLERTLTSRRW